MACIGVSVSEWHEDAPAALKYAQTHRRDKDAAPHWLRCDYVDETGARCRKGDGHQDKHETTKATP